MLRIVREYQENLNVLILQDLKVVLYLFVQ